VSDTVVDVPRALQWKHVTDHTSFYDCERYVFALRVNDTKTKTESWEVVVLLVQCDEEYFSLKYETPEGDTEDYSAWQVNDFEYYMGPIK